MSIAEFAASNPDLFWVIIYVAWGAVYGAITVALVISYIASKRYLKEEPKARILLSCMQIVWGTGQLAGVFAFPMLIGAFDQNILLHGGYEIWWFGTWALTMFITWVICRKHFSFDDLK